MKTITTSECYALGARLTFPACFRPPDLEPRSYENFIMIGDVLEKLAPDGIRLIHYEGIIPSVCEVLLVKWSSCGLSKSLQEILKGAERKIVKSKSATEIRDGELVGTKEEVITGPVAELFLFLNEIL